jgi:hypothetical protein
VINLGFESGGSMIHTEMMQGFSAVRRYERATELELLTKRIAGLARHRIIHRMVQQRAFELSPIPRRETEGHEEFRLGCPVEMNGTQ